LTGHLERLDGRGAPGQGLRRPFDRLRQPHRRGGAFAQDRKHRDDLGPALGRHPQNGSPGRACQVTLRRQQIRQELLRRALEPAELIDQIDRAELTAFVLSGGSRAVHARPRPAFARRMP